MQAEITINLMCINLSRAHATCTICWSQVQFTVVVAIDEYYTLEKNAVKICGEKSLTTANFRLMKN